MDLQPASLILELQRSSLLAAFKSSDLRLWQKLIDICASCEIQVMEFRDGRESRGIKLFPYLAEYAARYPQFSIGVASFKNIKECERFLKAGAAFVSSPFLHPALGELCASYKRAWIPGCSTCDEITQAVSLGASLVSVLPGSITAGNLSDISRALPGVPFMPSSGAELNDESIAHWLTAGATCIRREKTIFPPALISVRDWDAVERLLLKELERIQFLRGEISAPYATR